MTLNTPAFDERHVLASEIRQVIFTDGSKCVYRLDEIHTADAPNSYTPLILR